MNKIVQELKL